MSVPKTAGPGDPIHEHAHILCWLSFMWCIQGEPYHVISHLTIALRLILSVNHVVDPI